MGTDIHGRVQMRYKSESNWFDEGEIEGGRNYRVFAMLAGIRNGTGFAGVKTHEPIVPISEPRGLPSDIGELEDGKYLKIHGHDEPYWLGDHSHSWVSLKEVIDWPGWDAPLRNAGYLDAKEHARCVATGDTPKSRCGWTSDPTAIPYEWTVPFKEYASVFKAWIDYLALKYDWVLKSGGEVRLVFGFDS